MKEVIFDVISQKKVLTATHRFLSASAETSAMTVHGIGPMPTENAAMYTAKRTSAAKTALGAGKSHQKTQNNKHTHHHADAHIHIRRHMHIYIHMHMRIHITLGVVN